MPHAQRRHDVDWLRTIALGLLIVYHVAISFQPWGALMGFIANRQPIEELWPALSIINVWRIPLLFLVSGMGVFFAMRRRGWLALLGDRSMRILLPLVFGILTVCPLYMLIYQKWMGTPLRYLPSTGHLWFLVNIILYIVVLLPVFVLLRGRHGRPVTEWMGRQLRRPWWLFLAAVPLVAEAWIVNPESFVVYFAGAHGFLMGMICFLLGFLFASMGDDFWCAVVKVRWPALAIAAALFLLRFIRWETTGVNPVTALESTCWMLALLGFGSRHLNKPSAALAYLSAAVYTVYIVHMPVQYGIAFLLIPMELPAVAKLVLLGAGTFGGCFLLYEVLRRLKWVRPLFGMKWDVSKDGKAPVQAASGELGVPT